MPFPPFFQGPSTVLAVGRKKSTGKEDINLPLSSCGLRPRFLWESPPLSLLLHWFLFAPSSSQLAMKHHLPPPDLSCQYIGIFIYNLGHSFTSWITGLGESIIVCLSWISIITSVDFDFWTLFHRNPIFPSWNSLGLFNFKEAYTTSY